MRKEPIPKDLQIVGLVLAVLLTATLVEGGDGIDGGILLFLKSLPACAIGLLIFKVLVTHEFKKPKSWPEWILLYIVGLLIGGPLVALGMYLYEDVFH